MGGRCLPGNGRKAYEPAARWSLVRACVCGGAYDRTKVLCGQRVRRVQAIVRAGQRKKGNVVCLWHAAWAGAAAGGQVRQAWARTLCNTGLSIGAPRSGTCAVTETCAHLPGRCMHQVHQDE